MIDMNGNPVCETYGDECICTTGADVLGPGEYGHQFVVHVDPNCPEHGRHTWPARKALEGESKPARPDAHEMQGILGSEWLNGEDPADLVRRHREGRA